MSFLESLRGVLLFAALVGACGRPDNLRQARRALRAGELSQVETLLSSANDPQSRALLQVARAGIERRLELRLELEHYLEGREEQGGDR